jgi:hypothetical protein
MHDVRWTPGRVTTATLPLLVMHGRRLVVPCGVTLLLSSLAGIGIPAIGNVYPRLVHG